MDSWAMPFPFSHSRGFPRPLSWKGALPWVPPWSLEQLAAFLPGLQGTWAQLWALRGWEDRVRLGAWGFRLEPAPGESLVLPREQAEAVFQAGRGICPAQKCGKARAG